MPKAKASLQSQLAAATNPLERSRLTQQIVKQQQQKELKVAERRMSTLGNQLTRAEARVEAQRLRHVALGNRLKPQYLAEGRYIEMYNDPTYQKSSDKLEQLNQQRKALLNQYVRAEGAVSTLRRELGLLR